MKLRAARWGVLGLSAVIAIVAACSDGDDDGAPSYVGMTNTALVTVAAGGKINLGAVSVEIPQGAVDSDKEITVTVESKKGRPSEKDIAIDVYDFTDTQFKAPVKMSFDLKGVSVGNKKAEIAFLEKDTQTNSDKWTKLPDSKVADGKVSATTTHFSKFTVLLSPVTGGGGGGGNSIACDTGFQPCGNDLVGTWNLQTSCSNWVDLPYGDGGALPFPCKEPGYYEGSSTVSGFITFNADGTYSHDVTTIINQAWVVPVSCLDEISKLVGQPYTCETFIGGVIEGDKCVSRLSEDEPYHAVEEGTYQVDGANLAMTNVDRDLIDAGYYGGDSGIDPYTHAQFCVTGDTLRVRFPEPTSQLSATITEFSSTRGVAPAAPTGTDGQ